MPALRHLSVTGSGGHGIRREPTSKIGERTGVARETQVPESRDELAPGAESVGPGSRIGGRRGPYSARGARPSPASRAMTMAWARLEASSFR